MAEPLRFSRRKEQQQQLLLCKVHLAGAGPAVESLHWGSQCIQRRSLVRSLSAMPVASSSASFKFDKAEAPEPSLLRA